MKSAKVEMPPLAPCHARVMLHELQIAEKWTYLILYGLLESPMRFSEIKRRVTGISQKVQTQTLRTLERNGLVMRKVEATSPVTVTYSATELGRTLAEPIVAMFTWIATHQDDVIKAQTAYDARQPKKADSIR